MIWRCGDRIREEALWQSVIRCPSLLFPEVILAPVTNDKVRTQDMKFDWDVLSADQGSDRLGDR